MATGVKPRDEEISISRSDLDALQDAMKQKKFRDLLTDYCEEIRDPANQALYQKEMVQLEKERGYDIKFINPKGGYVIKTSVAGDRKAFINICSNDIIAKPSYKVQHKDGKKGMDWKIPYSIVPPREDFDQKRQRCVIYDVVFHPDTLRMAEVNKQFRELVNRTAFEGLQQSYNIHLDSNNFRFPKSYYKGMTVPSVIRKEDPNYQPPNEEETESLTPEMIEKLYPQHTYTEPSESSKKGPKENDTTQEQVKKQELIRKRRGQEEFAHKTKDGYTIPKYVIKQQRNFDLQEFTFHKDSKQHSAIPSHIVVEVSLPLLSSTKDCVLDVHEKSLDLTSEKPAKYKLTIQLPYSVNDECGSAKFDKSKHKLIVTLPVIRRIMSSELNSKIDSGVESDQNSGSQSDEDQSNLIVELSSTPNTQNEPVSVPVESVNSGSESFFDTTLGYLLPPYTHNILDDAIAFTFHVKNTEPDSVQVKNIDNKIYVKFTSIGSGFVPVHYAAIIAFDSVDFENVSGEAWDNNVILQLETSGEIPQKFQIGLNTESLTEEYFDMSHVKKTPKVKEDEESSAEDTAAPVVEVTNFGNETNIVVSSNTDDYDEDDDDSPSPNEREIVWTESSSYENGAKSILRKPMTMMRSYSESSVGDVASSMDYISSDCIPEESSYKKTVRFNDVISKQFYRYNSSIEGQKKKNQRKKSKKRNSERRKSESEAEDDSNNNTQASKSRLKSALKPRRDSGLADTSDAEGECKSTSDERSQSPNDDNISNGHSTQSMLNIVDKIPQEDKPPEMWETKTEKLQKKERVTCENIKHSTEFYNPEKLNKGQYQEVTFKNDLIFDLDM